VLFAFIVLGLVSGLVSLVCITPRDWLGRTSPKWPTSILCQVGHKPYLNQVKICNV